MQEHIKRLAIEAGFTVSRDEWVLQEMLERFAQAVARECIAELQGMYKPEDIRDGEEYAKTLSIAEDKIIARFGLAKD